MQILFHLMANTGCLPDKVVPQIPTNRMKGEDTRKHRESVPDTHSMTA